MSRLPFPFRASDHLPPRQNARASISFWMVTISGTVLTLLSFALLHLYSVGADEKRTEYFLRHIESRIIEKTRVLGLQMQLFSYMLSDQTDLTRARAYAATLPALDRSRGLDQLMLVMPVPGERGKYKIDTAVFSDKGIDREWQPVLQRTIIRVIQSQKNMSTPGIHLIVPDMAAAAATEQVGDISQAHQIRAQYIALVTPLQRADGTTSYVAGVLFSKNMLLYHDLLSEGQRFFLSLDMNGQSNVLSIIPSYMAEKGNEKSRSKGTASRTISVFETPVILHADFQEGAEQRVIQRVPLAIPFIGFLMTILGGLYVRNSQKQALMLTKMNKTLALKNMEMNSQVTERERLNQILRKTEQEKRAIMDSVSDIIFEVDQRGTFLFLNEVWYRITGFPVEQSKGLNLFDMMTPRARDTHRRTFEKIILGQETAAPFSAAILVSGDQYREMQMRYSMIRMDDNNNPRVVGTMTDMEEFRRTENALQEAEEKYRAIWENAVTGIYQASPDGQLISANPALARIFGYATPEDMLAHVSMMNRQLYASIKDRQAALNRLAEVGRISNVEFQGLRRDRSHFWMIESTRVVRDSNGEALYFEGSIDDITERKESELRLKSTLTELELANRAKIEFLANMSHELRTPLNAIIGFSEIIKDEVFGKLEQRQYHDYARDIYDSGRNLLGIINTILDVSRIEAGERQLNETVIRIPQLVDNVVDLVRHRIDENTQNLTIHIPTDIPTLWAEELAIKQILLNLLTNASKFTPAGGTITISARRDDTGDLRLDITDTGVGLDDEEIARVMAPFGQTSGSFARSSSGPGLGLTLVNALTRLHGGHFEITSQKGVGTTASIILPSSRLKEAGI